MDSRFARILITLGVVIVLLLGAIVVLLLYLAKIAMEKGCGRLEWAVLDWNQPTIDFYTSLGAEQMKEWIVNRVTGKTLEDLASQF